jgi:alpha-mannosidase
LPETFEMHGVPFRFGPATPGARNVVVPRGQTIALPQGAYNRVYVLAAAVGADTPATFAFSRLRSPSASYGGQARPAKAAAAAAPAGVPVSVKIQEWEGVVGQWNSRVVDDRLLRTVYVTPEYKNQSWTLEAINNLTVTRFDQATKTVSGLDRIRPGFVKRAEVAWVGTHRHAPAGNQPYVLSYVFAYTLEVPKGATAIRLPANDRVRILAMTAVQETAAKLTPAQTLYAPELPEKR